MIEFDGSPRLRRALPIPHLVLAWLALIVVVSWLLGHVTRALSILVLAALIAFALTPLINLLARWMPRAIVIAASYLVGFVVILALLSVVVVTAATELSSFVGHPPAYQRQAAGIRPAVLGLLRPFGISASQLAQTEAQAVSGLQRQATTAATDAVGSPNRCSARSWTASWC